MIALAVEKRILTDDRPRCTRNVAKAGNKATHDPEMFNRNYSLGKVGKILTNPRKVLGELYRVPSVKCSLLSFVNRCVLRGSRSANARTTKDTKVHKGAREKAFAESSRIVTGPSFTNSTCIIS
jgi:hypothetical protein